MPTATHRAPACAAASGRSSGTTTSNTPRTSPSFQSFFGLSGWVLWHCTHDSETITSAMAKRTVGTPASSRRQYSPRGFCSR